jgi:hypothetical protein
MGATSLSGIRKIPKSIRVVMLTLLFRLQQCVERKGVRAIVAKIISGNAVRQITLTLAFFATCRAEPLEVAHNQWIVMLERFGESLIARIPWSVQLSDIIRVGMRSSLGIV